MRWFDLVPFFVLGVWGQFTPVRDYSGSSFFDNWNFLDDYDAKLTWGYVKYVPQQDAADQKLAYVNDAGNAIIRVDNTTMVSGVNSTRNSIRLESKDYYEVGTVWIFDAIHMPYGCSVWPSFWTKAEQGWPLTGEIDIVEYINQMTFNQMAIHSGLTCTVPENQRMLQTGNPFFMNNCTDGPGCTVGESKPDSIGPAFHAAGGGVYACQFDTAGINIWHWARAEVPQSIQQSTSTSDIDISDWGTPSAAWPATHCDTASLFEPQQLVITITLCGAWANGGDGASYRNTCDGLCYEDNVIGDGSNYAEAYFEIPFIRAYSHTGQNTIVNRVETASNINSTTGEPLAEDASAPSQAGSGTTKQNHNNAAAHSGHARNAVVMLVVLGLAVAVYA